MTQRRNLEQPPGGWIATGPGSIGSRLEIRSVKRIWLFVVPGVILVLVGLVWTLQGVGVLGGSAMSGSTLWAIIGPIVLIVGVVLIAVGIARRRR